MHLKHLKIVSCILALFIGISGFSKDLTNIDKTVIFLEKGLNHQDESTLRFFSDKTYIQHNLRATDGKSGLAHFIEYLKTTKMEGDVVRVFEDKNFVVAHRMSKLGGKDRHVIDIFRFKDGLIVEHWDNIQFLKKPLNIVDGYPTKVTDLDKTKANKQLVREYLKDKNYVKTYMVLGQGNFVVSVSEIKKDKDSYSLYQWFTIKDNKIEHIWKVEEKIPPRSKWKNSNGKF
ncbi:hypothetical protein CRU98_04915 [Arcobacter sp. CECT 8986]|uniref:nuclear transport factor 2 family protein n=1 Tax=Arcobacter sp. CECT 8986 TaxID=2044507 RepID=UPI001009CF81|nr:nuclear transport factor 2 family protein [Arcobacter sp. CECT 8986]RXK00502.1 hypothetical protein CRU98_04915 [Arcobacter sp. CECT 8986]